MQDVINWHKPQDDPTKGITIRKSRQKRDEWLEEDFNNGPDDVDDDAGINDPSESQ
jgi:hypothetical protein